MTEARIPRHVVLLVAGGCAAIGIMLKVADLGSSRTAARSAADAARPAAAASRAATPPAPADGTYRTDPYGTPAPALADGMSSHALADDGRVPTAEEHRGGRIRDDATSRAPSERTLARRARHAERARERAGAGGSLEVGIAGSGGGQADLAAAGHHAGGTGAPPPPATVPPQEAQLPQFAYSTGDDSRYATNEQVEVPDIGKIASGSGTLSFWLQPSWQDGNQDDAALAELGDGRLQILKNVNFLRFEFTDDAGEKGGIGAPITDWKAGEWHQVTTTWSGNQFALYVDGQLVSQTTYTGGPFRLPPDAKLFIGSDFPENRPVAPGVIGKVDVTGRPLGPGEVARLFAAAGSTGKN
jgi:hypothetical protein